MAALQKIRSKGAFLIIVLGLALFAFIAEEFFRSLETTKNVSKQQVGEVYGDKLSVQEFQALVEQASDMYKMQYGNLNDAMQDQVRDEVWNKYVSYKIIEKEAKKLGMLVTDEEVQNALREGTASSLLRMGAPFVGQTGRFDYTVLQNFLKQYKEIAGKSVQMDPQMAESFQMINRMWQYTEGELRKELLMNKFNALLQQSFISNPVAARMQFDARNTQFSAEVAAIPFASIDDSKVTVTDADLKAMYEKNKELFRLPFETRDIKVIDVTISASQKDRADLDKKMQEAYDKLSAGENLAATVSSCKSSIQYVDAPLTKRAFPQDVQTHLDSIAVGAVKAPYYSPMDNTMNTFRLVSKIQAPDSVRYCMVAIQGTTPEETQTRTDSVLTALRGNASISDIAKKYQQRGDSVWVSSSQYENSALGDDEFKLVTALNTTLPGEIKTVETSQGNIIIKVLERKAMVTKYNVAIVKCPVDFSKDTYQDALNKFNRFIAANRTQADIEKNAGKSGYVVRELENFVSSTHNIAGIGGTKEAIRWIFDDAEVGDISKLYECGSGNDHLLLVMVSGIHEKGYRPWDDKNTKETLRLMVLNEKKGEMLKTQLANVKNLADAKKQSGVVVDSLNNLTFGSSAIVKGVNTPEPALAGLIARTPAGQFGKLIAENGAYMVQVLKSTKGTEKFDLKAEMEMAAQINLRTMANQLYQALVLKADVIDNRYKF